MRTALLPFAFVAGTVASANPCGFAILPAFFLSYAASEEPSRPDAMRRVAQALLGGAVMTLAFALVFGGVGAALSAGATVLMPAMPWATIVIGGVFVILGLLVLAGRRVPLRLPQPRGRSKGGYRGPFLFGVGYAVASLSCTLPVFLAVVGASAGAGLLLGAGVFLAYAAGMGTILTALALGAALARGGIHRSLRKLVPYTTRLSGAFVLAAGLYLIYYWTFFLLPGSARRTTGRGPVEALNRAAESLQNWFAYGGGAWMARVLLVLLVFLTALATWWGIRARGRRAEGRAIGQAGPDGSQEEEASERAMEDKEVAGRG